MANQRIYAIDALRGLTVAAMIIVNNAAGPLSYSFLQHSEWNGLTLCDMVFPSFLFIVGLTCYISLSKTGFKSYPALWTKIVKRTIIILLIGWGIHLIENLCKGRGIDLSGLRLTGVLPRIAICYFIVSAIALSCKRRAILVIIIALLAAYSALLLFGNGFANDASNLLAKIDNAVLGSSHIYTKRPIDPEGLMSTMSAAAHTLIGFSLGAILIEKGKTLESRLLRIMVAGFVLLAIGLAVSLALPLNKRVWSPSFTLATCGLVALALGAISFATDVKGQKRWFSPVDVFGVNPLFLYVLSELVAIVLSATKAKAAIYAAIASVVPDPCLASAVYSLAFVTVMWLAGYPLFKRKIYIKI